MFSVICRHDLSPDNPLTIVVTGYGMARLTFKWSRNGIIATGLFLFLACLVLGWVILVASKNPADSGESGILLLPFAMPWIMIIPGNWLGPLSGLAAILFNSLIIYCVFGGLRPGKNSH